MNAVDVASILLAWLLAAIVVGFGVAACMGVGKGRRP